MKKWIIAYVAALMLAGCAGISKEDIVKLNAEHKQALATAAAKVESADQHLAAIPNPPKEVQDARGDLAEAKPAIAKAQEIGEKVATAATTAIEKKEEVEKSFFSPKQKMLAAAVGVTLALIGLVIVLLRYGKLAGAVAAIPILGAIIARIGWIEKKK